MTRAYLHNGNIVTDENNAGFSHHLDPDQHVKLLYALQWIKKEFDENGIGDGVDHENSEMVFKVVNELVGELDPSEREAQQEREEYDHNTNDAVR